MEGGTQEVKNASTNLQSYFILFRRNTSFPERCSFYMSVSATHISPRPYLTCSRSTKCAFKRELSLQRRHDKMPVWFPAAPVTKRAKKIVKEHFGKSAPESVKSNWTGVGERGHGGAHMWPKKTTYVTGGKWIGMGDGSQDILPSKIQLFDRFDSTQIGRPCSNTGPTGGVLWWNFWNRVVLTGIAFFRFASKKSFGV